jgi:hypothetical protein
MGEIASLTEVIARAVSRPAANVHIEYAPAATNRLVHLQEEERRAIAARASGSGGRFS